MSFSRVIYLYCDGENCPMEGCAFMVGSLDNAREQRRQARQEGWVRWKNGQDFCSDCAPKTEGATGA